MKNNQFAQLSQTALWCFITLHVLVWTLIPNWARTGLPLDSAEGSVWGQHLALGYDRNPWLNGWLTRLAIELGGNADIFVYFFSQLCVALAFWSIWRLGRKILDPLQAVVAVLMLEAIQYYTIAAVDFNDNVLELGLWPLSILLFYKAVTSQRHWDWVGLGLVAGLAMMAKYYTAILLLSMLIFLLWHPKARLSFRQAGVYISMMVFILIILPHIVWLFEHDFLTIQYALNRVNINENKLTFWGYIKPGVMFALTQLLAFLGAVALLATAIGFRNKAIERDTTGSACFNSVFLWIVGAGPYLITVLLALFTGWQLQIMWGTPLLSCWGLLLVYHLKPIITRARFYRFLIVTLVIFTVFISSYTLVMLKPNSTSSGNFPAREFAQKITKIWHTHHSRPLPYVVGDRILTSDVARYSSDKPHAHLEWRASTNPWIDLEDLHKHGAIFIQRTSDGKDFPAKAYEEFPGLRIEGVYEIPYVRRTPDATPLEVLVGILAPTK
jgi:4-amino-4-deoxy-L-arabinose transferase-like glycosyltransferase